MVKLIDPTNPPKDSRHRWLKILLSALVILVALFVGLGFGIRAYVLHVAEKQLQETVAELDREDPGWRWTDILANREAIPDDQNSAPHVVATHKLLPKDWPNTPAIVRKKSQAGANELNPSSANENQEPSLIERLSQVEPNHRLDPELEKELQEELNTLAPALAKAKPLILLSKGRHNIAWKRDWLRTSLDDAQMSRKVAELFCLDAHLQAQQGKIAEALSSCRGALNTGRSVGDEPNLICQLVRIAIAIQAVTCLECVLGQGEADDEPLRAIQALIEDEAKAGHSLMVHALKGERGGSFEISEMLYSGEMDQDDFETRWNLEGHSRDRKVNPFHWVFGRSLIRQNQYHLLEILSQVVANADKPRLEQIKSDKELKVKLNQSIGHPRFMLAMLLLPASSKVMEADYRRFTALSCARAALAIERYRLKYQRWPDSLPQLVPEYLSEVPEDIYGQDPLRYRRLEDGVVIYSLGPDGQDNNGKLDRTKTGKSGPDIGFRLWDVKKRRLPPLSKDKSTQGGPKK